MMKLHGSRSGPVELVEHTEADPHLDIRVRDDAESRADVRELLDRVNDRSTRFDEASAMGQILEDYLCNGWSLVSAEAIGALTGCELIMGQDVTVNDAGDYEVDPASVLYWHERYQIESALERLVETGVVRLEAARGE